MIKKIILIIATFAIVSIAFTVYQWRESPPPPPRAAQPTPDEPETRPAPRPRSTQPAARLDERGSRTFTGDFNNLSIPPGENPKVHVFDEKTGEAKYVFQAARWEPVGASGTEFAMTEPNAEILLPKGQKAYVRADIGHVTVQRGEKNRIDPKRGWFKGNVRIIVDKTSQKDRKADPRLSNPSTHPETVYKFWLEDVSFDLDLANMTSEGTVKVQSADATLEGRGLELVWNEVNRRITKLRIVEGRRATFRSSSLMDFSVAGGPTADKKKEKDKPAGSPAAAAPPSEPQPADGNRPTPQADTAFNLVDPGARPSSLKENRIDSYRIVFRDNIVAEQRDGVKTIGRMKAAVIQVVFEVGQAEREAVQHTPGSQPAGRQPKTSPAGTAPAKDGKDGSPLEAGSTLVLDWTGEMIVTPEKPAETPENQRTGPARGPRLTATGNPVEIYSWGRDAGDATCQQLDYDDETKQVRLTGTPENPVRMKSGPEGELFGERVFFDGKTGFANVEGSGRLVTTRKTRSEEPELPECISEALKRYAQTQPAEATALVDRQPRVLTWKKSAQIQFDMYTQQVRDATTGELESKKNPYLKHAVLDGAVTFQDANQSMAAEYLEVFFRAPESGVVASRETFIADRILARGGIRMINKGEEVAGDEDELICEALDLELGLDPMGNNVPRSGKATGNVIARQGRREIRARDEIVVTLGLGPKPIPPEKRKRLEAAARECGYSPDSEEWKAFEAKRRRLTILAMNARGDVTVRDPKETLDVAGKELDCTFDEGRRLTRASIIGDAQEPAHAETGDFYIRGPRILMDVNGQSAQVPGAGMLRFYTSQDLDGRPVDKPMPVVVTWSERMSLDGQSNTGLFAGEVKARSDNSTLDCRELTLEFQNVPPPARTPTGVRSVWPARLFAGGKRKDRPGVTVGRVSGQLRKRLARLDAVGSPSDANGDAQIEMKLYQDSPPVKGWIARALVATVPDWLQSKSKSPTLAVQRRLLSGAYVSGPRVAINLIDEHLIVKGKGNLLIRDYRVPARRGGNQSEPAMSLMLGDASSGSLTGYSPGHTVFRWQNGMSFFNQKNMAVFDRDVEMAHLSGSELKMTPELAAVTGLTAEALAGLKGRKVGMTTDHLMVEFQREAKARGADPATLSRATKLRAFNAAGRVRMQDGGSSIEGSEVTYSDETGIARVNSSARSPAQVLVVDEKTGALRVEASGQLVEWNVKTQKARVTQPRAFAPGR